MKIRKVLKKDFADYKKLEQQLREFLNSSENTISINGAIKRSKKKWQE